MSRRPLSAALAGATGDPAAPAVPRWRLPLLGLLLAGTLAWSLAPQDDPAAPRRTPRPAPPALATTPSTAAPPAATEAGAPLRPLLRSDVAAGLFAAARPAPARTVAAPPPAATTAPAAPAAPAPAATPPGATPPPWQALGVLRERGGDAQALLQIDGQVLVARAGDSLPAGWRLEAITPTHLELTRADGPQRHRLPVQPGD